MDDIRCWYRLNYSINCVYIAVTALLFILFFITSFLLYACLCTGCDPYCTGTCTYANGAASCDECDSDIAGVSVARKSDGTCIC